MKLRHDMAPRHDAALEEMERSLRAQDPGRTSLPAPEDPYWQNLLVRTNARIDHVTSPGALSLSWLLRVAVPGVVAVASFVVALHYYAPERNADASNLLAAVQALPGRDVDSLLVTEAAKGESVPLAAFDGDLETVSHEQIAEYFFRKGQGAQLVESLDETQAESVLAALVRDGSHSSTSVTSPQ